MKEKLVAIRNFLYRLFAIGIVLNIFAQIVHVMIAKGGGLHDPAEVLMISPNYLEQLIISNIIFVRIFLIYFILCLALALHWTIVKDKNLS